MVSIAIYLDTRHAGSDGLFPLKLRVTHQRKQLYVPLGLRISENQWNAGKIVAHPQKAALNTFITRKLADWNDALLKVTEKHMLKYMTAKEVLEALENELDPNKAHRNGAQTDFFFLLDEFIKTKDKRSTFSLYNNTSINVRKFCVFNGPQAERTAAVRNVATRRRNESAASVGDY